VLEESKLTLIVKMHVCEMGFVYSFKKTLQVAAEHKCQFNNILEHALGASCLCHGHVLSKFMWEYTKCSFICLWPSGLLSGNLTL